MSLEFSAVGDGGEVALYDLEVDPGDRTNNAATHPEFAAELSAEMLSRLTRNQFDRAEAGFSPAMDPRHRRELESLGYLSE